MCIYESDSNGTKIWTEMEYYAMPIVYRMTTERSFQRVLSLNFGIHFNARVCEQFVYMIYPWESDQNLISIKSK